MEQSFGNSAEENHLSLSYWNVPVILRKLNKEDNSLNLQEVTMKQLDSVPISSRIEVMYENKVQPDCNPKTRVATGQFVDWGTKFYQLELELSYKNNEIEILKKKLKKVSQELYPEGDQGKKSVVDVLRNKQQLSERKLSVAKQQLQQEKTKSATLSTELAQIKKRYAALRKQKLSNDKSVQTVPDNNKGTQITSRPQVKCRTIMTQCSPVGVLSKSETTFNPATTGRSTAVATSELAELEKTNVQFASAVTIKDNSEDKNGNEPLEMCLLQEFDEGQVKTMVQANKSFKITEQPMLMSRGSYDKLKVRSIESPQSPEIEDTRKNFESDSGVSSVRFSSDSPQRMSPYPPNVYKPSYTQVMNQSLHSSNAASRMYERNMPYYLSGDVAGPPAIKNGRHSSLKMSNRDYPPHSHSESSFFREIQKHMIPDSSPQTTLPYYLFRREHSGNGNMKRSGDKPIFVHTSEISFPGY